MEQSDGGRPGIDRAAGGRDASNPRTFGYDVVSNLHGRADLERLLRQLEYEDGRGAWTHPDGRTPVFLGGVVDRHGAARPCASLVRELVDAGAALMTLGVEEHLEIERAAVNSTAMRRQPVLALAGGASRDDHGGPTASAADRERAETAAWLRTVPLWLDLPGLRVVHGCWSGRDIEVLRHVLYGNDLSTDDAVELVTSPGRARDAVRTLLAGATVPLPEHLWCLDARGELVRWARFRWWSVGPLTYRDRAVLPGQCTDLSGTAPAALDDSAIEHEVPVGSDGVPVVIARCSCAAGPVALSPSVLCLGVAGRGTTGPLAYRWSGESVLDATQVVRV